MNKLDKKVERLSNMIISLSYNSNYNQEMVDLAYEIRELLYKKDEKNKKPKSIKKLDYDVHLM